MTRHDRRSTNSAPPKPATDKHPTAERPAGEQAASPELWQRVQQAIRRLTSVAR